MPQHTLTFTLTHSELTHARSLCYELTDATEIIIINESHGVALFFFSFFLVVYPVGGGGGGAAGEIPMSARWFAAFDL